MSSFFFFPSFKYRAHDDNYFYSAAVAEKWLMWVTPEQWFLLKIFPSKHILNTYGQTFKVERKLFFFFFEFKSISRLERTQTYMQEDYRSQDYSKPNDFFGYCCYSFVLYKFSIYPIFYKDKSKKKIGNYIFLQISMVLKKTAKRNGSVFGCNISKVNSLFCAYHSTRMTGKAQVWVTSLPQLWS